MNKIFLLPLLVILFAVAGCQKQESQADRQAEIERQVQERLAAEKQAATQEQLDQRSADLDAREKALHAEEQNQQAAAESTPAPTNVPATPAEANRVAPAEAPPAQPGAYATFYRRLDPYGDWMETSDYGYVFQPRPAAQSRDWRPYTNGHWVYTDAGWTWISDEPFGWATYHYGRWIRLRSVGWVWVPGEQWAPAWVSWRKGNDYVGWAPLPPEAHFDRQTGIQHWADNYYDIGPEQYSFVSTNEFGAKLTPRQIVPPARNVTIINQTTNVTNIVYNNSAIVDRGPSYDDLRARSRQPIDRYRLEQTPNGNEERPVFRGQVVALPTVDFRTAERNARPNRVSRTINQPVVERGWSGITDQEAAAAARKKMKTEAPIPSNPPPKKFVRPNDQNRLPAAVSSPASPRAIGPRPNAPKPLLTPRPSPSARPPATPQPTATAPRPKERQSPPGAKPSATATPEKPRPSSAPSATPAPTETVTPANPHEAVRARQEAHRQQMQEKREQRQKEKLSREKNPAAEPETSSPSPTPISAPQARRGIDPIGKTSPNETPTPANKRPERRAARKNSRNVSPSPTETPQ